MLAATAHLRRALVLLMALHGASACQLVGGFEQFSPAADDVEGGAPRPTCADASEPHVDVSRMRLLRNGSRCFWMDQTEVSRDQYAQFLTTSPAEPEGDVCLGNRYEPASVDASGAERCSVPPGVNLSTGGDHPIVCVDWCDARAYCASLDKSLCEDGSQSDWYAACSNGARVTDYPFGPRHELDVCNDGENSTTGCAVTLACTTVPVGSLKACVNDAGVFDLSGNVQEWTDACDQRGDCKVRGGAMTTRAAALRCDRFQSKPRMTRDASIGFRCCYYPPG